VNEYISYYHEDWTHLALEKESPACAKLWRAADLGPVIEDAPRSFISKWSRKFIAASFMVGAVMIWGLQSFNVDHD
jgi:hypothetical protein